MAVLRSLLPQLGLFLCLALCFSPALSASYNDPCMVFDTISTTDNLGVNVTVEGSGGNITYTVRIPVNSSVSVVILKTMNQNNKSVGSWVGATQECNDSSVLYHVTPSDSSDFQATMTVTDSEDITKVNLYVFIAIGNGTAVMTSINLEELRAMTTANTTAMTTANTTAKTTAMTTAKTTATSLAVNALGSPLAGALHILLVFLISKLLF
ncbi:placenta-expressed transcript 1 protein [Phodopus roborovskii]|uniref:placenta-expressed transcript 1 protein n=1 Tax=Phodopus roborovskii TaxID=109678 RepID=UPI0021E46DC0|nr:placenta-expressed transcript 1 protein [Phodopus roborovskii]